MLPVSLFLSTCWLILGLGEIQYPIFGENGAVATTGDIIMRTGAMIPLATLILAVGANLISGKITFQSASF